MGHFSHIQESFVGLNGNFVLSGELFELHKDNALLHRELKNLQAEVSNELDRKPTSSIYSCGFR